VKLARTIRQNRSSTDATLEWKLANGIAESNNAAVGRIPSAARGFYDSKSLQTMIMSDRAGITSTALRRGLMTHETGTRRGFPKWIHVSEDHPSSPADPVPEHGNALVSATLHR
jgi:hypothetical protein